MIRLFVSNSLTPNKAFSLDEKALHYLLHVMRLKQDDQILCFNGQVGEWCARLDIRSKKSVSVIPQKQIRLQKTPEFLAICPALIKKDNFDFVLQKATEIGVTDIYPLITDHTVHAHFNKMHADLIVQEAAEQSERLTLPTIHEPIQLQQIKKNITYRLHHLLLS